MTNKHSTYIQSVTHHNHNKHTKALNLCSFAIRQYTRLLIFHGVFVLFYFLPHIVTKKNDLLLHEGRIKKSATFISAYNLWPVAGNSHATTKARPSDWTGPAVVHDA